MSILRRQQVLPTEAPRSWGWKQGGRASPLIHRTSTLPKPRATAHCGATQSPKEKRPPGSYPPALLPLGLRLVEPRGSLALLRRREAPGRPEEGAQGGRVSSIRQNSQIRNQKVQKLFPNRSPSHLHPAQSSCDLGGHSSSPAQRHPGVAEDLGAHPPRPVPSSPSRPLRTLTLAVCPTSHQSPGGQSQNCPVQL